MTTALAAAVVLVPLLAAAVGLFYGRRLPRGPGGLAVLATAVSVALAVPVAWTAAADPDRVRETSALLTETGGLHVTVGVRVDGLSATVALMVVLVALAVQTYSIGYMRGLPRYGSYAAIVSLFTAAMLTVVLAADLLLLYVGWEVMGLCSYLLIGHHWEDPPTTAAAVKAFLLTRVGDVGFLFGIFVLGTGAGSFRVSAVLDAVPGMSSGTLLAGTLLLTFGVVAKSAQFPLHSWLPDAMAGPSPVSALIHAATMVAAGVYVIARLYPAFLAAPATLAVLGVIAAISMLGAALAALAAADLKRVLAYSTISQLALMFAALGVGGRTASVAHLISHAAFKALLFLCAGAVIHAVGSTLMGEMGGLRRHMPITFATMTVGFAALAGLPPTSGFFSKDAVVAAAEHSPSAGAEQAATAFVADLVLVAVVITAAVTAAYATRAWLLTFFGPRRGTGTVHEAPAVMTAPLVALALPAMLLGLATVGIPELRPEWGTAMLSTGVALAGAAAAYATWRRSEVADLRPARRRLQELLARAFYTDDLYERTVGRATGALARATVGVDDEIVGGTVRGAGRTAWLSGGVLRLSQNGNAQLYVTGVLAGALLIAAGVAALA